MALKGVKIGEITDVYSHVHALGQCRRIIRKHGFKAHVAGDTAGAARQVAEWGDRTRAALAPRIAAGIYGLDILAEDVEDEKHNTTRFVVLSAEPEDAEPGNGLVVTTFIFNVRNVPAALYKAMGGFATNGVNMTKLESYQVNGEFVATMFYADIEGHPSRPSGAPRARGAGVLLERDAHPRHLSGKPLPSRDRPEGSGPRERRRRLTSARQAGTSANAA